MFIKCESSNGLRFAVSSWWIFIFLHIKQDFYWMYMMFYGDIDNISFVKMNNNKEICDFKCSPNVLSLKSVHEN